MNYVFMTPPAPGDHSVSARYRASAGGATNAFGPTVKPLGPPNGWMRIVRSSNQFSTYHSSDGTNWTAFGTNTLALAQTLNVGVGAVSHVTNPARTVTATFSDFSVKALPPSVVLTNWAFAGGSFSASFGTVNGALYTIEYKDSLTAPSWTLLDNTTGTGLPFSFTNQAVSATGQRYYRVVVQ